MGQQIMYVQFSGMKKLLSNLQGVLKTGISLSRSIPANCALDYVQLVKHKIIKQDFSYHRLSKNYTKWKDIHYPTAKTFWHLSGDLQRSVQVLQIGTNAFAGTIPASLMDSGHKSYRRSSSTSILKYALILEEGNSEFNLAPRPLFVPAAREFIANTYPKYLTKAVQELKRSWRT